MKLKPSAAACAVAVALATAGLFWVSRGKWSDAVIDSGREWIVPDVIARGGLLYRDVVYWFGPFTPYFLAAFFCLFGSSLATLVLAGIVGSVGVLGALYSALHRVAGRREAWAWTGLAVPALLFMPNSGGAILGMGSRMWHAAAFALLASSLACQNTLRRNRLRLVGSGFCAALAALCRTEWGLAALLSAFVALPLRRRPVKEFLADALAMTSAAFLLFGAVLAFFLAAAGTDALLRDAPVLLVGIPPETRASAAVAGVSGWRTGIGPLLYSMTLWVGVFLLARVLALRRLDRDLPMHGLAPLFLALSLLALLAAFGTSSGTIVLSGAPLACLAAVVVGLCSRRGPRSAALVSFGCLGFLLSHRRLFHIGDSAYVAPPLLAAFVCGAGLVWLAVCRQRHGQVRLRLRAAFAVTLLLLTGFAFAARAVQYASDDRIPVPGTDGMLSAPAQVTREITALASEIRRETAPGDGLVVFPEGELLNYLTGRPNPIRHKLYIPGYLTAENEGEVLAELSRAKPQAVVIWPRPVGEYGRGLFGVDYGGKIRNWIDAHYAARPSPHHRASHVLFAVRRERKTGS